MQDYHFPTLFWNEINHIVLPNKILNNMYNDQLEFLDACHMYRINNSIVAWQSGNIVQMCFQAFEYIKSMINRLDPLFLLNTKYIYVYIL